MNKYENLIQALASTGTGTMKCFGNSMLPILSNPSICTYQKQESYTVGDIVFTKIRGRYIDAHKITRVAEDGRYLISNNHGFDNGWTKIIFGRVIQAQDKHGNIKTF